ncbi:hypothetical protein BH11MYX2_BH11MYX2_00320 [soil metagenome]
MTTPAAFKKAMQQLTTTIVKAERTAPDSTERGKLNIDVRAQLDALLALHIELAADATTGARPHQTWFDETVNRARVILGEN